MLDRKSVGTGVAASSAEVMLGGIGQLQTTRTIDVKAGGLLRLASAETVRHLRIDDGLALVQGGVVLQELTMTGGVIETLSPLELPNIATMTSSAQGPAVIRMGPGVPPTAGLNLLTRTTTLMVNDGPAPVDLEIAAPVTGTGSAGLIKDGAGTLRFTGMIPNTYPGQTLVRAGVLELERGNGVIAIPGALQVGDGTSPAKVAVINHDNIGDTVTVRVGAAGRLDLSERQEIIGALQVSAGGFVSLGGSASLATMALSMAGGRISLPDEAGRLVVRGDINASSTAGEPAAIHGAGTLTINRSDDVGLPPTPLAIADGPQPIDMRIAVNIGGTSPSDGLIKRGAGVALIEKLATVGMTVEEGTLLVTGVGGAVTMTGGALGGTGTVDAVSASGGRLAPGLSPGRLRSLGVTLNASSTLEIELNGVSSGADVEPFDKLDVRGAVSLGNAALALLVVGFTPPEDASFTIIANDATDPVTGTFAGLAEGATVSVGDQRFTITYRGGDGNDVVLTASAPATPTTYYLAEGATGGFFDNDVLIANANDRDAPVTLTFLQEGGTTVVEHRVVPAMARVTVHVDQIAGLESTAASVQVVSDERLPLIVERSMFWDASYYGGHTANAVAQPETRWIFAEGFQGFFDTYILIANADAEPTTATLTFLREGETPVLATVPVGPFARKTVYAGDYPELQGRAFGIIVEATHPVIAERAMYFASQPGRLWAGGHVNTGIVTPSPAWFHAEGATGGFFNTFILLSNPQDTAAHVELRFLLDTGEVITRQKTLEARQRLTVNPAGEGDVRLENAAVSTVVQADMPIVSERSMYWPGEATPFGEGHNSSGVASLATRWGLAEGRLGGPHGFDTFILLANPSTQAADVTITYLRETGTPIVQRYTVPATSRFNVDVKTAVPALRDTAFGARIEVTNAVPIAVERSLYWNANGVFWAGGTNALATPLP